MEPHALLEQLERAAEQSGLKVRYEKGNFVGGACRLMDRRLLIINKRLDTDQRIQIIARELAGMDLGGVYVVPAVREAIENSQPDRQVSADLSQ